jgi:hypothetical protein
MGKKRQYPRYNMACCRLSDTGAAQLQQIIDKKGMSASDIMRTALVAYMKTIDSGEEVK